MITGDRGFVGTVTAGLLTDSSGYDIMDGFDIRDLGQLDREVARRQPDRILHLAAVARFADADADPVLAHETNVIGTRNVALVAERYHVPVVYASTGSVYMPVSLEPPITEDFPVAGNSVYGVTKYLGELYVRRGDAPWIILRYAHLYGAEKRMHGLVGGFLERVERGLAPTLYGGGQSNDFTYVADVARANVLALTATADKWRQAYNVGTGEELTTAGAADMICEVFGYTGEVERVERRGVDPMRFFYDTSKAARMLGFTAEYSFRRGLEEMREVLRARG